MNMTAVQCRGEVGTASGSPGSGAVLYRPIYCCIYTGALSSYTWIKKHDPRPADSCCCCIQPPGPPRREQVSPTPHIHSSLSPRPHSRPLAGRRLFTPGGSSRHLSSSPRVPPPGPTLCACSDHQLTPGLPSRGRAATRDRKTPRAARAPRVRSRPWRGHSSRAARGAQIHGFFNYFF